MRWHITLGEGTQVIGARSVGIPDAYFNRLTQTRHQLNRRSLSSSEMRHVIKERDMRTRATRKRSHYAVRRVLCVISRSLSSTACVVAVDRADTVSLEIRRISELSL